MEDKIYKITIDGELKTIEKIKKQIRHRQKQ